MPMPVPGETAVNPAPPQQITKPTSNTPNKQQPTMSAAVIKQSPSKPDTSQSPATNQNNNKPNQQAPKNENNKPNNQATQQENNKNKSGQKNGPNQLNNQNKPKFNNNHNNSNNSNQGNGKQPFEKSKFQFQKNNNHNNNDLNNTKGQLNTYNQNNNTPASNNNNHNHHNGQNNKFQSQNGHYNNQMNMETNIPQVERKFTGRCRLFCGNLPADLTEEEFKVNWLDLIYISFLFFFLLTIKSGVSFFVVFVVKGLFKKFGETGECFLNTQRSFGFIKLDTRLNAEQAKQELDGMQFKNRTIRVRFATHGAAVRVKNLSPYISNEYLEQAFSMFGPVERAVVIVDDKGRPTGEGIVEFERKPASIQCINKCQENCFILTSYPRPIVVEPLEQKDEEDGLPEKSIVKNAQFYMEREAPAHFASNNSNEHRLAMKWRELYELEKQIAEEGKRRVEQVYLK